MKRKNANEKSNNVFVRFVLPTKRKLVTLVRTCPAIAGIAKPLRFRIRRTILFFFPSFLICAHREYIGESFFLYSNQVEMRVKKKINLINDFQFGKYVLGVD